MGSKRRILKLDREHEKWLARIQKQRQRKEKYGQAGRPTPQSPDPTTSR
jgi:ribosomal protein L44E